MLNNNDDDLRKEKKIDFGARQLDQQYDSILHIYIFTLTERTMIKFAPKITRHVTAIIKTTAPTEMPKMKERILHD